MAIQKSGHLLPGSDTKFVPWDDGTDEGSYPNDVSNMNWLDGFLKGFQDTVKFHQDERNATIHWIPINIPKFEGQQ